MYHANINMIEYYVKKSHNIPPEITENIQFTELISPLQQEFKSWKNKISHLHPK